MRWKKLDLYINYTNISYNIAVCILIYKQNDGPNI
jgi:hypothetical protein